jgi:hypothetical protein
MPRLCADRALASRRSPVDYDADDGCSIVERWGRQHQAEARLAAAAWVTTKLCDGCNRNATNFHRIKKCSGSFHSFLRLGRQTDRQTDRQADRQTVLYSADKPRCRNLRPRQGACRPRHHIQVSAIIAYSTTYGMIVDSLHVDAAKGFRRLAFSLRSVWTRMIACFLSDIGPDSQILARLAGSVPLLVRASARSCLHSPRSGRTLSWLPAP